MRQPAILADRRQAVREAARDWMESGWMDSRAFEKVEQLYPDDRIRTGPAFRTLFFILTLAAIAAFLGAAYSQVDRAGAAVVVALAAGGICCLTTEYLINQSRRRQGGIESAFSIAAIANLLIAATIFVIETWGMPDRSIAVVVGLFLFAGILLGAAAWAWGYWLYMAVASACVFAAIINVPWGRFIYLITALVACRWLIPLCSSVELPPSLRKSAAAFTAVTVAAVYAGTNIFLLDDHFFDWIHSTGPFPRWLAIACTVLVPFAIFLTGFFRRQRMLLILGFASGLLSLATLRAYIHVAPPWIVLVVSGIALMGLATGLRRFLDSGPGSERAGFTACAVTGQPERLRAAEIIATLGIMTPKGGAPAGQSEFHGGEGKFGGGGASGKF
jgi:hypothetical protein